MIRTKDQQLISLGQNLKPIQKEYVELLRSETGNALRKGLREIILKGRQEGLSTVIAALFFLDTINNPRTYSVIVAHEAPSTERMFQMVQRFYKHLPDDKPKTKYANKREFYWPDLDSSFFVGTAGSEDFGRSATVNNAHLSEVAFWPDAGTLLTGLLQSVPKDGNVFIESTANGFGNYYQEEWDLSENNRSTFTPRFFPWFNEPDYRSDPPEDFERTPEEEKVGELYGLTDDQLQWYREKGLELKGKLAQEYPHNPTVAFLVSGNPYFDNALLLDLLKECPEPVYGLDIEHYSSETAEVLKAGLKLAHTGFKAKREGFYDLEIWELPEEGEVYAVGVDPAEGLNPKGDPDSCSCSVINMRTGNQVAHLAGRWNTHEFGTLVATLGFFYNTAIMAIERNNHGHAVINTVLHTSKYPEAKGMETRGVYLHLEYDDKKNAKPVKPGWPTTAKTKTFALDNYANDVEGRSIKVRSKRTIAQMLRFVHLPGGKMGGEAGSHDDDVISMALANAMLHLRPRKKRFLEAQIF